MRSQAVLVEAVVASLILISFLLLLRPLHTPSAPLLEAVKEHDLRLTSIRWG